jgi:GntR family transcriptional repressor for pyruvate dehydrogenase complex
LARQLGVGRTSVREALQKLQTMGVVEVRRGRGAYVREPGQDDAERAFARWSAEHTFVIEDLLEARIALECANAGLAAARASEEQIAELEAANHAHREAGRAGDLTALLETDQRFHEGVAHGAHNPLLDKIYRMLDPELAHFRRMTLAVPRVAERSALAHQAVLEAIRSHDPSKARAAMLRHLWVLYEEVEAAAAEREARAGGDAIAPIEALF